VSLNPEPPAPPRRASSGGAGAAECKVPCNPTIFTDSVIRELAVWRARRRLVRAERVLDQPFSRERSLRLDAALLAYEQAWGRP
jgi:hypothetical protein